MLSKCVIYFLAASAYSPILLVVGLVEITNSYREGKIITYINNWQDFFNRINFIWVFIVFVLILYSIFQKIKRELTIHKIEIKTIKSANINIIPIIMSFFLPCVELYKKDIIFVIGWVICVIIIICFNTSTYFYIPILKLFGFNYYEVTTEKNVTYIMISKKKIINTNQVKSYSQLADFIILNQT
jgi:hypothetical protein